VWWTDPELGCPSIHFPTYVLIWSSFDHMFDRSLHPRPVFGINLTEFRTGAAVESFSTDEANMSSPIDPDEQDDSKEVRL
jgi:hypothetical protein